MHPVGRRREEVGISTPTKVTIAVVACTVVYFSFLRGPSPLTTPGGVVFDSTLGTRVPRRGSGPASVLVTGGAGFIGSHVIEELNALGFKTIILDDRSNGHNSNPKAKDYKGDITSVDDLSKIETPPDYVVHLAAKISVADSMSRPKVYEEVNVAGSENVFNYCIKNKVRRVVSASSAAIYGEKAPLPIKEESGYGGLSPYASSKFDMELIQKKLGESGQLNSVALRFFNVYGPRQDPKSPYTGVISIFMDRAARNQKITINGDGGQTRDFISVKDIARAIIAAMVTERQGFDVFNVCTGRETSVNDLARIVTDVMGSTAEVTHGPPREGDIRKSVCDPSKLNLGLGYVANVPLKEGLNDLKNWFLEEMSKEQK
jgi:UDP-glucose 4-epimerase